MKAGLLPRLSDSVSAVYVEATANETEARLLRGLRGRVRDLPDTDSLAEAIAWLRQSDALEGKKLLIVLDQFEQWLHAGTASAESELVRALRHCDGEKLQCILLIRDDFWMAGTRFMKEVEVRIVDGHNSAAVDVLSSDDAQKTLAAFGRAYGALPENPKDQSKEQQRFLQEAVEYISVDGQVIPVDLAILFEIMKGKSWTLASLKNLGGAEGIGVAFLDDMFSAATASPECRLHREAAKSVFRALLPAPGTNLKGKTQSRGTLLAASGYEKEPKKFDELLTILDSKLHVVTPSDPEAAAEAGTASYQLSHDFLVRPLRVWLRRQQSATWRGAHRVVAGRSDHCLEPHPGATFSAVVCRVSGDLDGRADESADAFAAIDDASQSEGISAPGTGDPGCGGPCQLGRCPYHRQSGNQSRRICRGDCQPDHAGRT